MAGVIGIHWCLGWVPRYGGPALQATYPHRTRPPATVGYFGSRPYLRTIHHDQNPRRVTNSNLKMHSPIDQGFDFWHAPEDPDKPRLSYLAGFSMQISFAGCNIMLVPGENPTLASRRESVVLSYPALYLSTTTMPTCHICRPIRDQPIQRRHSRVNIFGQMLLAGYQTHGERISSSRSGYSGSSTGMTEKTCIVPFRSGWTTSSSKTTLASK